MNFDYYKKEDEEGLVEIIDETLSEYLADLGCDYVGYKPSAYKQNFADLDSYCADLLCAFGRENLNAVALEVKFNTRNVLKALEPHQRSGLVELQDRGVPIYYSYNSADFDFDSVDVESKLLTITTVRPKEQLTKAAITDQAKNLKAVVDFLLNGSQEGFKFPLLLSSFVRPQKNLVGSKIRNLTTKVLLLIYNKDANYVAVHDVEVAEKVVEMMMSAKFIAKNKGGVEFSQQLNMFVGRIYDLIYKEQAVKKAPSATSTDECTPF